MTSEDHKDAAGRRAQPEGLPFGELGFVALKKRIRAEAQALGVRMSDHEAKRRAREVIAGMDPEMYRRICYPDPVGERVANRDWYRNAA